MQKFKTIDEFMVSLDDGKRSQVEVLRTIILEVGPSLIETIKWNAPNYAHEGDDRITFNLMNKEGVVKLVLHMGATRVEDKNAPPVMHDDSGLVRWNSDIRGMLSFASLEDIKSHRDVIGNIIQKWLHVPV